MSVYQSTFNEHIDRLSDIFDMLQNTSSLNEKRAIVDCIPNSLRDDFDACLDVLAGRMVFGFKMAPYEHIVMTRTISHIKCDGFVTVREALTFLLRPRHVLHDLTEDTIVAHLFYFREYWTFFQPIIDHTVKLGIGPSVLEKLPTAPMLAKKWSDFSNKIIKDDVFITEKLDGNRCIAIHDGTKWNFISRNGKPMYVNFDMRGLPTNLIYDGEVCSEEQTAQSRKIHYAATYLRTHLVTDIDIDSSESFFSKVNGIINSHTISNDLVYTIFDVQNTDLPYTKRRFEILDKLEPIGANVRILPLISRFNLSYPQSEKYFADILSGTLNIVTNLGGEGLMINIGNAKYERKRSSNLLKVKNSFTMDMLVLNIYEGTGKYEGMVGGLICQAVAADGRVINCNVGSGISDTQRYLWMQHPETIVGSIIEVEYFAMSQDQNAIGTNQYSLRFPRFKKPNFI